MSLRNIPSGSSYQTAWNKALEYLDQLPPVRQEAFNKLSSEQQKIFRSTVDSAEIIEVLRQSGASKRSISRLRRFNENVVQPFLRLSPIVDTVVQLNPGIGSPIWAPIKIILQVLVSVSEGFEKIEAALQETLGKLPLFDEYEKFFRSSKPESLGLIHDALTKFYIDVIDLTLVITKHYRRSMLRSIFRSTVNDFDSDFDEIISNMKGHVDAVSPKVVLGGLMEARQNHQEVLTGLGDLNAKADQHTAAHLEERELSVRKWLSRTNADADQQKNQQNHLSGTCNWFFQKSEFHNWRDYNHSGCLWARGIPGCGKSVLSSVLVGRLKKQGEFVVYFFCKESDENRNNPRSILRTLLWQFLGHPIHKLAFIDIVYEVMLKSGTPYADSTSELWGLLKKIIGMLSAVYCVVDALDECDNKGGELVDFLAQLTKLSSDATTAFKIFATCRLNEPHIEEQLLTAWSSVAIERANIQNDVGAFITNRINKSITLSYHKEKVYSSVLQGADGMFLWARLMLDDLSNRSSWEVEKVLADMPEGLDAVYDLLFQRVSRLPQLSIERCKKVLNWSLIARQPLSVDELSLALAVSEGLPSHEAYTSGLDQALEVQLIRQECGSLITILEDETVQLVHTSLRTYLLKEKDLSKLEKNGSTVFSMSPEQAHMDLAIVCLQYNMLTCFQNNVDQLSLSRIKTMYPFLRHSTCNWIYHVSLSGNHYDDLSSIIDEFFNSKQGWRWLQRCWIFDITNGHLLVLQGELKSWTARVRQNTQTEETGIGDFVLHLSKQRYEDGKRQGGEDNIETIGAAHVMASFYNDLGQYGEALEWYERALAGKEKALGKGHSSTLSTVNNMAIVYRAQGRYSEALEWYERALAGHEKALGKEHPSTLDTVNNMAIVYSRQGRYSEALEWYERALAGYEKALGKEHSSTLDTVNNMALVYSDQGRYSEALEWYERALAGYEKALGKEHPSTLVTVNNMALVYRNQGRYSEALEWYERALAGKEKALGKEHSSTLDTVNNMAFVYSRQGRYSEALEWCERALSGYEKALGKEHPLTLDTVNNMAIVYSRQGRYSEALEWFERALAGMEKALGKEHPSTIRTVKNLEKLRKSMGISNW